MSARHLPFALLCAYAHIAPTERGGFHLARAARRLVPRSKWNDVFATGEGVRLALDLANYPDFTMAAGLYELATVRLLKRLVRPGMHIVDAGANIGFFTCRMARLVGASGRVEAFEPDPRNRARLQENLARNGIEAKMSESDTQNDRASVTPALRSNAATVDTAHYERGCGGAPKRGSSVAALLCNAGALARVCVHAHALSDRAEQLTFHRPAPGTKRNHGESGRFPKGDVLTEPYAVQAARLDEAIEGAPDLVKLDVEGSEPLAVRGATRWLQSERPPIWIIEHNPGVESRAGWRTSDIWREMLAHRPAYRCSFIGSGGRRFESPDELDRFAHQGNLLLRC